MDLNHPYSFQSKEEEYFYWYLKELKEHDYVTGFQYQPKPFSLSEPVFYYWIKQLKTKQKQCRSTLLQAHDYQADFTIYWAKEAHLVFHTYLFGDVRIETPFISNLSKLGKHFSVVDVKGTFNQQDNIRRFSISQKWVWKKFNIFVQKIVPVPQVNKNGKATPANALFPISFTPKRYHLTDKEMKPRKIRFTNRPIENFVKSVQPGGS